MKVTIQNLTKTFPSRDKAKSLVTAVDNFNLEVPDGKLVALLGPSGCGKSTMLFMIAGLLKPTGGKIFFGDTDVSNIPTEHRGVGLVFQNYALYPHLTVEKNIAFPLENLKGKDKLSKQEIRNRVIEAARIVSLEKYLERKPGELSGGQQQRVAIARALIKRPPVLLLDEPLSNLDARLRLKTREELRRIQKETGITTIFVTHDQDEAMSISDTICVMKGGKLQQTGIPQEVYDNPKNLFVAKFLGTPQINLIDKTLKNFNVVMAVRPEAFEILENNDYDGLMMDFNLERIETQGRDTTLILSHPDAKNEIRAIVPSEKAKLLSQGPVTLGLKEEKIFFFYKETGRRLEMTSAEAFKAVSGTKTSSGDL